MVEGELNCHTTQRLPVMNPLGEAGNKSVGNSLGNRAVGFNPCPGSRRHFFRRGGRAPRGRSPEAAAILARLEKDRLSNEVACLPLPKGLRYLHSLSLHPTPPPLSSPMPHPCPHSSPTPTPLPPLPPPKAHPYLHPCHTHTSTYAPTSAPTSTPP